jgi:sulfonate transport system substrate-binding protein
MRIEGVFIAAALAMFGGACAASEPVTIRVGWAVVPASLAPILTAKPGLARHVGQSYTLEPTHFSGTPQQMAGLAAGEIDLGAFGYSTMALAVENAGLDDLRVVCDILQDGAHGSYSNEFMVLNDGLVRTVEDLRGKAFGTSGAGSTGDIAMRVTLRRHGIDDKAISYVEIGFPNMKSMLLSQKADIITAITPFSMDPELRRRAHPLFSQKDAIGPTELLMMAGRAEFLAKNHAAVVDFLEDNLRAVRWYRDPKNHDEAVAIVAAFTKQPPALFQSWIFTDTGDQYRDPDGLPDIEGAAASIKTLYEFGYLKAPLDAARYFDLSLVKEAAARLDH